MGIRQLLVTDLDGTLLGDAPALRRFTSWLRRERSAVRLVYATGRHPDEIRSAIAEGLPPPDVAIAALGTEIMDWPDGAWRTWSERFDPSHGDRVRSLLEPVPWLEQQEDVHQSALKASYHVAGLTAERTAFVERTLETAGIDARLIYSSGRFLDVLPAGVGKGPAAELVAAADDEAAARLAFGDSGNDLDLLSAPFNGTIVANATPEIRAAAGPRIYRSPFAFADGVLDGIDHWTARRAGSAPH